MNLECLSDTDGITVALDIVAFISTPFSILPTFQRYLVISKMLHLIMINWHALCTVIIDVVIIIVIVVVIIVYCSCA